MYLVREQWDQEQLGLVADKVNTVVSIICKPEKIFRDGTDSENFGAACRYFHERLDYIYIRRCIFSHLEKIPFSLSLSSMELSEEEGNSTIVFFVDHNTPIPEEFQFGLLRTKT